MSLFIIKNKVFNEYVKGLDDNIFITDHEWSAATYLNLLLGYPQMQNLNRGCTAKDFEIIELLNCKVEYKCSLGNNSSVDFVESDIEEFLKYYFSKINDENQPYKDLRVKHNFQVGEIVYLPTYTGIIKCEITSIREGSDWEWDSKRNKHILEKYTVIEVMNLSDPNRESFTLFSAKEIKKLKKTLEDCLLTPEDYE